MNIDINVGEQFELINPAPSLNKQVLIVTVLKVNKHEQLITYRYNYNEDFYEQSFGFFKDNFKKVPKSKYKNNVNH